MRYSSSEFEGISSLLKIDLKLFVIVMTIVFLGLSTLYSVSSGDTSLVIKQSVRIIIGLVAMILLAQIHPDNFRLFLQCFILVVSFY